MEKNSNNAKTYTLKIRLNDGHILQLPYATNDIAAGIGKMLEQQWFTISAGNHICVVRRDAVEMVEVTDDAVETK